jgi:DNA-binding Xre family transcriptional regulator
MMLYRIRELLARREIQERRRLSFEDLSAATGISPQVLTRMADPSQEYHTTTRNLEILAQVFGVPLDELVEFHPPIERTGHPIPPIGQLPVAILPEHP